MATSRARIHDKILLLVYKVKNGLAALKYLSDLVSDDTTSHRLRSTEKGFLAVPRTNSNTYIEIKQFFAAGPKFWNTLQLDLRAANFFLENIL